mmetsp:Transcript_113177/g.314710  ORF Transcript_113177/g.314710 Transcript_113177/m.314710 type:complete len:223 (-) Transcript_113177:30-698(-)
MFLRSCSRCSASAALGRWPTRTHQHTAGGSPALKRCALTLRRLSATLRNSCSPLTSCHTLRWIMYNEASSSHRPPAASEASLAAVAATCIMPVGNSAPGGEPLPLSLPLPAAALASGTTDGSSQVPSLPPVEPCKPDGPWLPGWRILPLRTTSSTRRRSRNERCISSSSRGVDARTRLTCARCHAPLLVLSALEPAGGASSARGAVARPTPSWALAIGAKDS